MAVDCVSSAGLQAFDTRTKDFDAEALNADPMNEERGVTEN
jgi:hypothetical protein